MQVLAVALGIFLRLIGVNRRPTFIAVLCATLAYTLLVGLMPSVVRSAVMTISACIAGLFDRSNKKASMFALAAVMTLLLDPTDLFDVGCQLSFLAVAAIIWLVEPAVAWLTPKSDPLDEAEARIDPRMADLDASHEASPYRGSHGFDARLAGSASVDGTPISPRGPDQRGAQPPARSNELARAPRFRDIAWSLGDLDTTRPTDGLGGLATVAVDRIDRALGIHATLGTSVRTRALMAVGARVLSSARDRDRGVCQSLASADSSLGAGRVRFVDRCRFRRELATPTPAAAPCRGAGGRAWSVGRDRNRPWPRGALRLRPDARPLRRPSRDRACALVARYPFGSTRSSSRTRMPTTTTACPTSSTACGLVKSLSLKALRVSVTRGPARCLPSFGLAG